MMIWLTLCLLLEHADFVLNNCTQCELNDLDKIQNEAARMVSGTTKLASINLSSQKRVEKHWDQEENT